MGEPLAYPSNSFYNQVTSNSFWCRHNDCILLTEIENLLTCQKDLLNRQETKISAETQIFICFMLNVEQEHYAICVILLLLRQTLNWDKWEEWEETIVLNISSFTSHVVEGSENFM